MTCRDPSTGMGGEEGQGLGLGSTWVNAVIAEGPGKRGEDKVTLAPWRHCSGGSLVTRVMAGTGGGGTLSLVTRESSPGERQPEPRFQQGRKQWREGATLSCCPTTQMTLPSLPHWPLCPLPAFPQPSMAFRDPASARLQWGSRQSGTGRDRSERGQSRASPPPESLSDHHVVSFAL